jgi:hypothetical protein
VRKGVKVNPEYLAGVDGSHDVRCPQCQARFVVLPVAPLYTLKQTCLLVPCSETQLKSVLVKKKAEVPLGPVQYRHDGRCRRRIRLLSVDDIKRLRAYFVRPKKVA